MANTTDYSRLLDGYALLAIKEYIKNNYAAKSHTHTKSQITDFPSSMPASDVYAWAKAATKPSYTHNEIGAGNLTVGSGNYYLNMRNGHSSYNGGIYYSTPGNEAIVFANKNAVTSWIFATTDVTGMANWTTLVPSLQIKNGKVVINKLIADGAYASYTLDVNGDFYAEKSVINKWHRDTYYASNVARHFYGGTPTEFVIKTKIKYVSSTLMPLIRIYGYAYGLNSPIELRVAFYIYDNYFCNYGVSCTGAWKPEVYLFSYTEDSVKYVAIGFKGSCYYCGFQVDAQIGALGAFNSSFSPDGWSIVHNGSDTSVSLIPAVGTDNCAQVPYRTMKTDIEGSASLLNGHDASYYLNYNNLTNKPTIPSVSNATITIKQTGISDQTFTLNGSATTITLVDTNTWRPLGTGANDACAGNDSRLSNARPASDVYSWAKASTKPSYTYSEVGAAAAGHNHDDVYIKYSAAQTLTDVQKTQARSNIGAGTSNFTGYTSSNKLHTDYINNAAGWTSVTESTVSGWGFTKNAGTVTQVKVGTTAYNPSSGVISLPAYPTKASWNYDDVYIKLTGNQSISGTKTFTGKVKLSDGQNSYAFSPGQGGDALIELIDEQSNKTTVYLMNPNTPSTAQYIALRSWVNDQGFLKTAVTKLGSRTGDITIANLKTDLGLGSAAYTNSTAYATSGHTHTLSIASGGTASINLAANTTYTLTAGGKTYAFKTPASGGGYYANQYNTAYYLSSNSDAMLFSEDIQSGVALIGLDGGNALTISMGWGYLASNLPKRSLLFSGNRVDLTLTDQGQYYFKGLSIDMYDDDYYTLHIRANDYSDLRGTINTENNAAVELHASSFRYSPSYVSSAVTYNKYVALGVVMHNINYTYSSTVLLKMNIRGRSPSDSAITSYSSLCGLLYHAGHRSAATCLTCSGRYSSYSNIVLGVYATAYNSGLYLVYCSASSNTVNTTAIASGTVTDTLSASLVP